MKKEKIHLVWFKKDLRIFDNEAIFKAAKSNRRILFFYIFEDKIIDFILELAKVKEKPVTTEELYKEEELDLKKEASKAKKSNKIVANNQYKKTQTKTKTKSKKQKSSRRKNEQ